MSGGDEAGVPIITHLVIWLAKGERLLYRLWVGKPIGIFSTNFSVIDQLFRLGRSSDKVILYA